MEDEGQRPEPVEKYCVKIWVNRAEPGRAAETVGYVEDHFFVDRPEREIVLMLFEDAKRMFLALYPDDEPNDYTVNVVRLRPADDYRPDFRPLT